MLFLDKEARRNVARGSGQNSALQRQWLPMEYHGIRCSPVCVFLNIEVRLSCPYFA